MDAVRLLGDGVRVIVRPSGTEPKLKAYLETVVPVHDDAGLIAARGRGEDELDQLRAEMSAAGAVGSDRLARGSAVLSLLSRSCSTGAQEGDSAEQGVRTPTGSPTGRPRSWAGRIGSRRRRPAGSGLDESWEEPANTPRRASERHQAE